jgi:hypothetical protein
MKKVLLHACCGVCFCACSERLLNEGYIVEGFFYNPNIFPFDEYRRRKGAMDSAAKNLKVAIIEGPYCYQDWMDRCSPYADEPEGGRRCEVCIKMRLVETFRIMQEKEFDYFTTTLTVSPHKKSKVVFTIAKEIGESCFLDIDFKKKGGFNRTIALAKKYDIYRQNYCGCVYSQKDRRA